MPESARTAALGPWLARLAPRSAWLAGADDAIAMRLRQAIGAGAKAGPWQPFAHDGPEPPPRPVDVAYLPALGACPPEQALAAAHALRPHARILVMVVPTAGPHRWPEAAWRSFEPWALHESRGELAFLCAGGRRAEDLPPGPRVWYLAPNQQVFGGIKVLYQHVAELNALGIPAAIASEAADCIPATWFAWDPSRLAFGGNLAARVRAGDTVVLPDILRRHAPLYARARRRVLFAQGPSLVFDLKEWPRLGIDAVLTLGKPDGGPSFLQRELARRGCALPTFGVPNQFSGEPWGEVAAERRPGRVLCLPRKGARYVAALEAAFPGRIVQADGLRPEELASAYAAADVYAHTAFPEGFGMPLAEAALSGCVLAGFAGGGGGDLMDDGRTAFVAADGDAEGLVAAVRRALEDPGREAVRAAGRAAARGFDAAAQRAALDACWRGWLPTLPPSRPRRQRLAPFAAVRSWLA